jgi:uncharacterized RDD family membrane protein YckC
VTDAPAYAHWFRRAAGALVDIAALFVVYVIGVAVSLATDPPPDPATGKVDGPTVGSIIVIIGAVLIPVVWVWNRGLQQGGKGESLGRSLTGTRLVVEATGRPLGAGAALNRDLTHLLDLPLLLGFLWPWWDRRRQTFADKLWHTVVVRADLLPDEDLDPVDEDQVS